MLIDTSVTLFLVSSSCERKSSLAWLLTYVVKLTALTMVFVSFASKFQIHEASRTFRALRSLTIGLHLFTYTFRISLWLQKQKNLTVGQQCLASLQPSVHTQQQVKSFLEFSKPVTTKTMQPSNKTILERSIGRPAMMAFVLLTGIYLTTGQLIPGVV